MLVGRGLENCLMRGAARVGGWGVVPARGASPFLLRDCLGSSVACLSWSLEALQSLCRAVICTDCGVVGRTRGHTGNLDMVSVRGRVRKLGLVGWSARRWPAGSPAVPARVCGPQSPAVCRASLGTAAPAALSFPKLCGDHRKGHQGTIVTLSGGVRVLQQLSSVGYTVPPFFPKGTVFSFVFPMFGEGAADPRTCAPG